MAQPLAVEKKYLVESFPSARLIEGLPYISILRYPRNSLAKLPPWEKSALVMEIQTAMGRSAKAETMENLVLSAYTAGDILDPMMNEDCQIDLIRGWNGTIGVTMTHFGGSYERIHFHSSPRVFPLYLDYVLEDYLLRKSQNPEIKDLGFVLNAASFPYNKIPEWFEQYQERIGLVFSQREKYDGSSEVVYAEQVYRLYRIFHENDLNDMDLAQPENWPTELSWPPVLIEPNTELAKSSGILIASSIRHNSFDPKWLTRRRHRAVVYKDTGEPAASCGYQMSCEYANHQILVATDSAVVPSYRRQHIGSTLRRYCNQVEAQVCLTAGKPLILIADFLKEQVADTYGKVVGLQFVGTRDDPRNNKAYWIGLQVR